MTQFEALEGERVTGNHQTPAGICDVCHRAMRWQDEPVGPPARHRAGVCMPCERRRKISERYNLEPEKLTAPRPDTTRRDRDWMDQYVARRRREGVPINGIELPGEERRRLADAWARPLKGETL
jgi:hypothetical protein